jgi:hypothetical protein
LFPLSKSFREGELKGVSKNEKERGDADNFFPSFPLSNSVREGEFKGGE